MVEVREENMENYQKYMVMGPVRRAMGIAFSQALLGIGAATLAVIGLEHFAAAWLLAIATIVVGAGLLFEGGVFSARYTALVSQMEKAPFRLRGWMVAEFVAGLAGITLGILALLNFAPFILIPVAAMSMGIAQILNSGLNTRLNALEISRSKSDGLDLEEARETVNPYTGLGGFMGLGALVLGVVALAGITPLVLSLIAILSIAAAHLLNGAVVFRMLGAMYRRHSE
jgi:hypothetical protein